MSYVEDCKKARQFFDLFIESLKMIGFEFTVSNEELAEILDEAVSWETDFEATFSMIVKGYRV
jgi:prophage maintenance system killer protein